MVCSDAPSFRRRLIPDPPGPPGFSKTTPPYRGSVISTAAGFLAMAKATAGAEKSSSMVAFQSSGTSSRAHSYPS